MKRVLSLFLSVLMLTSIVVAVDLTSYASVSSGDYAYTVLDDGTAEITEYSGNEQNVEIPTKIGRYTVTSIGNGAFYYCTSLTSVTIPDGVTSVGYRAFYNCKSLTSVTIGNGVTSIGDYSFQNCTSLTSITIPDSVTSIGYGAFYDCTSLISITIGNSVTSIGIYAFGYCTSLTSVTIPDSVTSISSYAFNYCTSLTSITIPDSVTSIGIYAFEDCVNLENAYYHGTKDEWKAISIGNGNGCLTSATIHYNSTVDAAAEGSTSGSSSSSTGSSSGSTSGSTSGNTSSSTTCKTHTWNSGKTTKAATCSSTGVKTYTCTKCGATKTEKIAKKSHTWKVSTKSSATNKKNGKFKCSVCGATKTIYYPKTVKLSATSYTYNGKAKKPSVTIKDSNGSKISSKYYTVSYISQSTGKKVSSMKNPGKYYVKVTFKTRYSGSIKKAVTIKPKKTSIKKITASKKGFTVKWGKVSTQNTGYQIQYSTSKSFKNAKTATIKKTGTTSKKVTKLKAKKKYYVRVRTYKTVKINGKNTKIYSAWSSVKGVTTKK